MNNKSPQIPDDFFRDQFREEEVPIDPQAWEHMKTLLDKDDKKRALLLLFPAKNKKRLFRTFTLILIVMLAITTLSLLLWMAPGGNTDNSKPQTQSSSQQTTGAAATVPGQHKTAPNLAEPGKVAGANPVVNNTESVVAHNPSVMSLASFNGGSSKNNGRLTLRSDNAPAGLLTTTSIAAGDTPVAKPANFYQHRVIRRTWVPEEYEFVRLPSSRTMDNFWIGIHYTDERARFSIPGDSSDFMRQSGGFNVQFMSGNYFNSKIIAGYAGLDWGMQFYGRTNNVPVALNTLREDSGYTRMHSSSIDFLARGHWEFARFPVKPYINLMAGPRIYMTGQKVASYLPLDGAESSDIQNIHTSVSLLYGAGVGARVKLNHTISLDARYEMLWGTPVEIVNIRNSSFHGLGYSLDKRKVEPVYSQVKVGLIFNLSSRETEKRIKREGYWQEEVYDSLVADPNDPDVRFLPCPETPVQKPRKVDQNINDYERPNDFRNPDIDIDEPEEPRPAPRTNPTPSPSPTPRSNPSPSPSKPKSDFPGIKTPTPTPPKPPTPKPPVQH